MITVLSPQQFKTIPWKNGQGETIELAINAGGKLDDFIWRLSMATVVEDGVFSDFSGYQRNLILIEGHGINLQHDNRKIDQLNNILDIANFDGGCRTVGNLPAGEITDFNIITDKEKCSAVVETLLAQQTVELKAADLCFIYSLSGAFQLTSYQKHPIIKAGHLLKLNTLKTGEMTITGQKLIVVYLTLNT
ncbi:MULTISPECIES: HutD/Ves family protein [unclassified Colwellia]|uniref:HutD/Ves family protein n=1 Tax=unclassified Colwellia TaxID=196834 RepID=UPI0015F39D8D|nr:MULTISPECIES: HutD family protein [unclassified Colwellia]MBA6231133.1 HutD family protein [Colwellia sp. MB02u-7]MBA6235098.1 HutD family protein [Colwellia sp. MB02u-11]MBA6301693.1 HutD family protein [Colwellia sp. MB3u-22]MBA6309333.1 HutD family protein [Colwellia sp. MB3u-64]